MSVEYGCLFCVTGHERNVVHYLLEHGIKAISPVKIRFRRHAGKMELEKVILFPGYVFFAIDVTDFSDNKCFSIEKEETTEKYSKEEWFFQILKSHSDIINLLYYDEDSRWSLSGEDKEFVEQLFSVNGEIGISKAYYIGEKIHIQSGFLKKYESLITAVNRRAKTVHVAIKIGDKEFGLWLGFEEIPYSEDVSTKVWLL